MVAYYISKVFRFSSTNYPILFKMQDVMGAMNGTHIIALVSTTEQVVYNNRHVIQLQNILIIYDHDM